MLTAKKSPKSSSGPGGSMWGPQLGEDICMVDCVRGKDCSCTCARTAPGPGPAQTTVKPRSRPPLRFSGLELEVGSGLREISWRGSDTLLQSWHQPCWYPGDEDGATSSTFSAVFKEHFTTTLYSFSSDGIGSKTHRCLYRTCSWVLME